MSMSNIVKEMYRQMVMITQSNHQSDNCRTTTQILLVSVFAYEYERYGLLNFYECVFFFLFDIDSSKSRRFT